MDSQEYFEQRQGRKFRKPRKPANAVATSAAHPQKARRGSAYAHVKTGFRPDLGITVRSTWEANLLRVLNAYGIAWDFEPQTFYFPVKRGNKSYIPDIYLKNSCEWIEVKGYLDNDSKIKLKRFKKYNPIEFAHLTMVISKYNKAAKKLVEELAVPTVLYYEDLVKQYKDMIPTWEG